MICYHYLKSTLISTCQVHIFTSKMYLCTWCTSDRYLLRLMKPVLQTPLNAHPDSSWLPVRRSHMMKYHWTVAASRGRGHLLPVRGSAPTFPQLEEKMAKISHFRQIFGFFAPSESHFAPSMPPQKFLVPPLPLRLLRVGVPLRVLEGTLQLLNAQYSCQSSCNVPSKYPQRYSNSQ